MPQFLIRPVEPKDLTQFKDLVNSMKTPLASLPNNKATLSKKIKASLKALGSKITTPGTEHYLFVLEEIKTKKIAGVCGIHALSCGTNSFFAYELEKEKYVHKPLNTSKNVDVLHLREIKKGPSEMCSLYLKPKFRKLGQGKLLSLSRYLYMRASPKRFSKQVIAILRGYRDKEGNSPFWQSIGKHFFDGNLESVDSMKSLGHKSFIRDLMPKNPIYVPLLDKKAQAAIGNVHTTTQAACILLKSQGFKQSNLVDIFDAGPIMNSDLKNIHAFKNSKQAKIHSLTPSSEEKSTHLLANQSSRNFRACLGNLSINKNKTINLSKNIADTLKVKPGDTISFLKL